VADLSFYFYAKSRTPEKMAISVAFTPLTNLSIGHGEKNML
jgi:hypothetical protein